MIDHKLSFDENKIEESVLFVEAVVMKQYIFRCLYICTEPCLPPQYPKQTARPSAGHVATPAS